MRLSPKTLALLGVVALPVGTLILAKLFGSAVLGWMFGLMLVAGVALVPLAAIVYACYRLVSWILRRSKLGAAAPVTVSMRTVKIERNSVHASDDAPSRQITVSTDCTLREVVVQALADGYLPRISGNRATWVLEASRGEGHDFEPIAVWAQQQKETAFLTDPERSAASLFGDAPAGLRFKYRCQDDPSRVLDELVCDQPKYR